LGHEQNTAKPENSTTSNLKKLLQDMICPAGIAESRLFMRLCFLA